MLFPLLLSASAAGRELLPSCLSAESAPGSGGKSAVVRAGIAGLCLSPFYTGGFGLSSCLSAGTEPGSGGKSALVNPGTVGVRLSAFRIGGFGFDACCLDRMNSMRLGQLRSIAS